MRCFWFSSIVQQRPAEPVHVHADASAGCATIFPLPESRGACNNRPMFLECASLLFHACPCTSFPHFPARAPCRSYCTSSNEPQTLEQAPQREPSRTGSDKSRLATLLNAVSCNAQPMKCSLSYQSIGRGSSQVALRGSFESFGRGLRVRGRHLCCMYPAVCIIP
jgi:hypothetical protein